MVRASEMIEKKWDIFISHASEDTKIVAQPLADTLRRAGVKVWLDEYELKIGDSLIGRIEEGLSKSRFGAVILSPAFLAKLWPKKELAGLRAREVEGRRVVLPIWHSVEEATVREFSPILADTVSANTAQGIDHVAKSILDAIFAPTSDSPSAKNPSVARRLIEMLEAGPMKEDFVDFLRFHLLQRGRYLGWGGRLVLEKHEFYGIEFDAYAPYVGHGCSLRLVSFTEVWQDPFDEGQAVGTGPSIRHEIQRIVAGIKSIKQQFAIDKEAQSKLRDFVIAQYGGKDMEFWPVSYWEELESEVPELHFFVFAGRRSTIDESAARHESWSKLLNENRDVTIKTYDFLIDAFLE
jgi:hypothetical protein